MLERKVEALGRLLREGGEGKGREVERLRARVVALGEENARLRNGWRKPAAGGGGGGGGGGGEEEEGDEPDHDHDAAGVDELEDEARARLQARVRSLEDELFELRRGVWRDRRRDLQPGLDGRERDDDDDDGDDDGFRSSGFDDVDLSGAAPAGYGRRTMGGSGSSLRGAGGGAGASSTFQDVLNSGLSAFGAGPVGVVGRNNKSRKESLGLLNEGNDDDDDEDGDGDAFDEEAFRAAQEEEARRRVERVREVKRGLSAFKGWRVDLVDVRSSAGSGTSMAVGAIFDV